MRPQAWSSPSNGGAGDGQLPQWPEEFSPEPWSVARWQDLIIMVPGHIIIPIPPIILLRQQAITLRAIMVLRPVKVRSLTAFTASSHTILGQEPILAQTDTVTRAPEVL